MKCERFYLDLMQDYAEVTGNFLLGITKIGERTIKFATDCGLYQEKDHDEQNTFFPTNPEEVEFVILTHNHVDHTGRLGYFVRNGFEGKIYTTEITRRILGRALYDSARILKDTNTRKHQKGISYDAEDVEKTLNQVVGCDYNKPIKVNENMTLTFIPNGHLLGAASALLQIHCPGQSKDINILFSGDYNNKNMFFRVAPIRKWITELPINIVIESTYGYMDSSEVKHVFAKNILKAITEGKSIVIPVFSLGRAQEILFYLKDMQKKYPEVFDGVPIYYDGKLSFYYTDMYYKLQKEGLVRFYKDKQDFMPENLTRVEDRAIRKDVIKDTSQKIIVTTSGMGSYGPAQTYLPVFIGRDDALIHFTGYCSEGTLGYRLKYAEKGEPVEVGGAKTLKRADVEFTNEFSAHAKADELIKKFLKKLKDSRFIMVNHGKDETKDIFADRILAEIDTKYVGILGREYFYRIDKDGFVKGMTSKFL